MPDLARGVDAHIELYRPHDGPPAEVVQGRRTRRNRTRAVAAVAMSAIAVGGVAFGSSAFGDRAASGLSSAGIGRDGGSDGVLDRDPTGPWQDALWGPPAFVDRVRLPSCGAFEVVYGEVPPHAIVCMTRAIDGPAGAELALSLQPIDGAPILTYTRLLPGGQGVEVFEDGTRNQNGWIHKTCAGFDASTGLGTGCQTTARYPPMRRVP